MYDMNTNNKIPSAGSVFNIHNFSTKKDMKVVIV